MPLKANAQSLEAISGPTYGKSGDTLTFVVEARDSDGTPQPGVDVLFSYRSPDDNTSPNDVTAAADTFVADDVDITELGTYRTTTDVGGRAQTTLILRSDAASSYQILAWRVDDATLTVDFTVTVDVPPPPRSTTTTTMGPLLVPTTFERISGDDQEGLPGTVLAEPFVVEVRDQNGEPLEGVTVTFAAVIGGGAVSVAASLTDSDGRVESVLTLGTGPGANKIQVSVEGISQTVVFNAEGTHLPLTPTSLSIVSGINQTGLTGDTLMDPFVVEIRDQFADLIEGVTVTFTVLTGGGVLSAESAMTDANGRAESTLTLGTAPGEYTVEVAVEGVTETVTFTVLAELLEFDLSLLAGLNLIHIPLNVRVVNGMAQTVESVADLYDALGGAGTLNWLITHDPATQEWYGYFGDADRDAIADRVLTDQTGILASIKIPISVRLGGEPLGDSGMTTIALNPGLNLVGLPLKDSRLTHVSDLLGLEGSANNVYIIVVADNGIFKLVGRADDEGDIPITGGQAFILIAQYPATIPITGTGWQR